MDRAGAALPPRVAEDRLAEREDNLVDQRAERRAAAHRADNLAALEIQGLRITRADVTQMMSDFVASRISLVNKTGPSSFSNRR